AQNAQRGGSFQEPALPLHGEQDAEPTCTRWRVLRHIVWHVHCVFCHLSQLTRTLALLFSLGIVVSYKADRTQHSASNLLSLLTQRSPILLWDDLRGGQLGTSSAPNRGTVSRRDAHGRSGFLSPLLP